MISTVQPFDAPRAPALVPPAVPPGAPAPVPAPAPVGASGAASPIAADGSVAKPEAPAVPLPEPDPALLLGAYGRLFGTLPRVGAAVIALASFGYFLGWQNARAYYGAFGADWVVGLLSTMELLQQAYWPLLMVCAGLLLGVVNATTGNWSMERIRLVQAVTGLTGGALLLSGDRYDPSMAAFLARLGGFAVSACIGMIIAQHARALRDQGLRWNVGQLSLITYLWPLLILQLPLASGKPDGRAAADARASTLPHVTVDVEDYRLVLAHADRLVVAKLRPGALPVLRIVPSETATAISDVPSPSAPNAGGAGLSQPGVAH